MTGIKPIFENVELDFKFKEYTFHSGISELSDDVELALDYFQVDKKYKN